MYEYAASLVRVIDGDTLIVNVDLGFYLRQEMTLRLAKINTPSVRGVERDRGLAVKAFVEEHLKTNPSLAIRTDKIGKWRRYIADVYFGPTDMKAQEVFDRGTHLNQMLLDQDLAVPYED